MNSFKKSHSRILTILLVMLMLVTMLAGCKKDDTTPEDNQSLPAPNTDLLQDPSDPTGESTDPADATEPLADNIAVVIADQLTVRSGPSADKNPIGTLTKGTHVEILRTEELNDTTWALIREGWIPMEFVQMANEMTDDPDATSPDETEPEETKPQEQPAITTSTKGVITGDVLNIRSEPSTAGQLKGAYSKGDTVTILETKNGWGRTDKGWISMQYVNTGNTTNITDNDTDTKTETTTGTTTDGTAYFITAKELNIRSTNSTNGDIKGQYKAGDRVVVTETKDGWGKTDKGWISMTYAYKTGAKGNNGCNGVVTGDTLNVRSGPGTGYNGVGSLTYGTRVTILQRITIGNTTWGCTEKGWISMDYVYVDGTKGEKSGDGTIVGDQLNIRSGPGTGYGSVGSLNKGDTVEILEQIKIGDTTWGCIAKGWISMDYVTMG